MFNILEGIFPFQLNMVKMEAKGAHHKVFTFRTAVLHISILYGPSKLRRNDMAFGHFHMAAFPEGLDAEKFTVRDFNVIRVPKGGPTLLG